jgi:hypothetical protein
MYHGCIIRVNTIKKEELTNQENIIVNNLNK